MTAHYEIQTVCECQALLGAELDESKHVLHGWANHGPHASPGRRDAAEPAPANSVAADGERFDVVWKCPMCGRNTLRSFYQGALKRLPQPAEPTDNTATTD